MKKTNKIILITLVVFILLLGIGYAAIQNITLNISGTAAADPNQANFKVRFVGTPTVSDNVYVTAGVTGDTTATINVNGLSSAGERVSAVYTVKNESDDLSADLSVLTTNENTEYFWVTSSLNKTSLLAGEEMTVTVNVELTQTPIEESVSTTIGIKLEAIPVQPGEEGTSEEINGFSQVPEILNEYGFYYNRLYTCTLTNDTADDNVSYKFYENGGGEIYVNGALFYYVQSDFWKYEDLKIQSNDFQPEDRIRFYVKDNGNTLQNINHNYFLDKDLEKKYNKYIGKQNEYGFYFGEAYSIYNMQDESVDSMVLYEDGSIEFYKNYKLALRYPEDEGDISDSDFFNITNWKVLEEGKIIEYSDDRCWGLDVDFWKKTLLPDDEYYGRYDNSTGKYDYYKVKCLEIEADDVYLSNGYWYVYDGWIDGWRVSFVNNWDKVPSDYIYCDINQTEYGEILEYINDKPVVMLNDLFNSCLNMKKSPVIPSTVRYLNKTFASCTSLEGEIVINSSVINNLDDCFEGVDFEKQNITLKGESTYLDELGSTGINYCVECNGKCKE